VRYSSEHKAETRAKVLKEAAREIRAKGPEGVGVAGVMKRAGLTHGGFYAHFESKDDLIAEAIEAMFVDARTRSEKLEGDGDPRAVLRAYLDFYLSPLHRDARERGCPLPTLSGDFARAEGPVRDRFAVGVERLTNRLVTALERIGVADAGREGNALIAQLVGAVALARSVSDGAQSDALLADTHAALIARYGLEDAQ
jgi:TetR/AcrR family transcriptional repressor of nem operon